MYRKSSSHNDPFTPQQELNFAVYQALLLASVPFVVLLLIADGVLRLP